MTDDDPWKNPLWEREILNSLKSELRSFGTGASITPRHGDRLFGHKFRRGFTYRDVVCIHDGRYSAFKVDREPMGMMHSLPEEWRSLFSDVEFKTDRLPMDGVPQGLERRNHHRLPPIRQHGRPSGRKRPHASV